MWAAMEVLQREMQGISEMKGISSSSLPEISFIPLTSPSTDDHQRTIAFLDGGQADMFLSTTFCLSLIRIATIIFQGGKRRSSQIREGTILVTFTGKGYRGEYFPRQGAAPFTVQTFSLEDDSLQVGWQLPTPERIVSVLRRLAELAVAAEVSADKSIDVVVIDGLLQQTLRVEKPYLAALGSPVIGLAKTSSVKGVHQPNPVSLLQQGPSQRWYFPWDEKNAWVKLHPHTKHLFHVMGDFNLLPDLALYSSDASFLGYPYGLMAVDQLARISHQEKELLRAQVLARHASWLEPYLSTGNAHAILDRLWY